MRSPARAVFIVAVLTALLPGTTATAAADPTGRFELLDVFQLQYASDPQIAPAGDWVVYVRHRMDIRKDRRRSSLWMIRADGTEHRPVTSGATNDSSPRWSPDGKRLLYLSEADGVTKLHCRWMDTGQTGELATLTDPAGLSWSPDGRSIAVSISESEQLYQALRLRKIDTALVRVPGASHDIGARPSHLMAKAAYVLEWFRTHRQGP